MQSEIKKKLKILIVEDEQIQSFDMKDLLEGFGYEVPALAATKDEAIAAAEQVHPDLVLMDIALEEKMDGVEAAKVIQERFHIPLIYVTAYADAVTMEEAQKANPIGYIFKPFGEYSLRKIIEEFVNKMVKDATKKD